MDTACASGSYSTGYADDCIRTRAPFYRYLQCVAPRPLTLDDILRARRQRVRRERSRPLRPEHPPAWVRARASSPCLPLQRYADCSPAPALSFLVFRRLSSGHDSHYPVPCQHLCWERWHVLELPARHRHAAGGQPDIHQLLHLYVSGALSEFARTQLIGFGSGLVIHSVQPRTLRHGLRRQLHRYARCNLRDAFMAGPQCTPYPSRPNRPVPLTCNPLFQNARLAPMPPSHPARPTAPVRGACNARAPFITFACLHITKPVTSCSPNPFFVFIRVVFFPRRLSGWNVQPGHRANVERHLPQLSGRHGHGGQRRTGHHELPLQPWHDRHDHHPDQHLQRSVDLARRPTAHVVRPADSCRGCPFRSHTQPARAAPATCVRCAWAAQPAAAAALGTLATGQCAQVRSCALPPPIARRLLHP